LDGLRGIAIALVLLGHVYPDIFPGGYLGVDLFLVISGFVISMVFFSGAETSRWGSLQSFLTRRVNRLLPALAVSTLTSAIVLGVFYLVVPAEYWRTGSASLLGLSNVYLQRNGVDYFFANAENNPFTHTWSLGVEAQFYFIYAVIFTIFFVSIRRAGGTSNGTPGVPFAVTIFAMTVFSMALSVMWLAAEREWISEKILPLPGGANEAFYLIAARLYEPLLGVSAFLVSRQVRPVLSSILGKLRPVLLVLLGALVFAEPLWGLFSMHIMAVLSGFVIVSMFNGGVSSESRFLTFPALVAVGRWSYSIYLWHWPLLVFSKYFSPEFPGKLVLVLALSIGIGYLSYRFIELPCIRKQLPAGSAKKLVLAMALSVGVAIPVYQLSDVPFATWLGGAFDYPALVAQSNSVLLHQEEDDSCFGDVKNCPAIHLVGDSHARHLFPVMERVALAESRKIREHYSSEYDNPPFGLDGDGKSKLLESILESGEADDWVVMSFHRGRLNPERDSHLDAALALAPDTELIAALEEYAKKLGDLGIRLIFVLDTPLLGSEQDVGGCVFQLYTFGVSNCRIDFRTDDGSRTAQKTLVDSVSSRVEGVVVWDPLPAFYQEFQREEGIIDVLSLEGHLIMSDANHLSVAGALGLETAAKQFFSRIP
jgi:peptidoglycan/LPS O-acetylase OafA/YrhL